MNKINVTLAATLAACSVAYADATVQPTVQTFENEINTDSKWAPTTGWTIAPAVPSSEDASDYPSIETAGSPTAAPGVGYGVVNAAHTKVLSLNGGTATVEMPSSSSGIITSDLLVKVVRSSLDTLSVEGFTNPKLAIAVDKDGKFQAWTGATTGFSLLSDTVYPEDTWVRVTTLISNDCCRIALNGQLACNGAWLKLSNATTAPSELTVQSSSCIDDVVVKAEESGYVYDKYAAVNSDGSAAVTGGSLSVPTNYKNIYNVATDDETAMTAARAAYEKGVAPNGTFAITEGSFDGSNVTLTFPGDWPADAYVVKYGSSPNELTSTATMSSSAKSGDSNTVVVGGGNMSEGTVLYYQVTRTL